jgi:hypothetical protein
MLVGMPNLLSPFPGWRSLFPDLLSRSPVLLLLFPRLLPGLPDLLLTLPEWEGSHSRTLSPGASPAHCAGYDVAGIQHPGQRQLPIVSLDARRKHSGMTCHLLIRIHRSACAMATIPPPMDNGGLEILEITVHREADTARRLRISLCLGPVAWHVSRLSGCPIESFGHDESFCPYQWSGRLCQKSWLHRRNLMTPRTYHFRAGAVRLTGK